MSLTDVIHLSLIGLCGLAATAGLGAFATGRAVRFLHRRNLMDVPNARSSHRRPIPRGGGIGVLAVVLPALLAAGLWWADLTALAVVLGAGGLAALSWIDDRSPLPAGLRLGAQLFTVAGAIGVAAMDAPTRDLLTRVPGGLWLALPVLGLAWAWFINVVNFMDGIDGLAGTQTAGAGISVAILCLGAAALDLAAPVPPAALLTALALAGAALGFLRHNWHPARVFLGDVGSVPIGFLLGWVLVELTLSGLWAAALLVPLYFWMDATSTLLMRLVRRQRVWQAHRLHAYQCAVDRGWPHDRVCHRVATLQAGLLFPGAVATLVLPPSGDVAVVAAASIAVGGACLWLRRSPPG